ncbi:hypothetical protein CAPTEDRAFT_214043 [Capitella teleta]|uniref:Uncharacterized protein n=1 Tax=Capitella teleta TaxID=283909 RepID=R7TRE9_CAPTE|nr:hypothetical protein CAPTEDRAFT_214043 [Capitella teleta]|eukprot:ELT94071.1 hypothetical protein CAPTEDRAFT_214043 [Capitella teleta]
MSIMINRSVMHKLSIGISVGSAVFLIIFVCIGYAERTQRIRKAERKKMEAEEMKKMERQRRWRYRKPHADNQVTVTPDGVRILVPNWYLVAHNCMRWANKYKHQKRSPYVAHVLRAAEANWKLGDFARLEANNDVTKGNTKNKKVTVGAMAEMKPGSDDDVVVNDLRRLSRLDLRELAHRCSTPSAADVLF